MDDTKHPSAAEEIGDMTYDGERAFEVPTARFGMWVFISTEIMLFAGIFAGYLVIRLASPGFSWPAPTVMHVSVGLGVFNTLLLVLSSVTLLNAVKTSRHEQPATAKLWLLATFALGGSFLFIKGYEYTQKYQLGLMPSGSRKQIYDEADYQYLAAVDARLKEIINEMETQKDLGTATDIESLNARLDYLYDLQTFFTGWTVRMVGNMDNGYEELKSIRLLANLIYPVAETSMGIDTFVELEGDVLARSQQVMMSRRFLVENRQKLTAEQITGIEQEMEEARILNPQTSGQDGDEMEQRASWLASKQRQAETLARELDELSHNIDRASGRLRWLLNWTDMEEGLNKQQGLKLPVVIVNGQQWIGTYLLITGIHALHVLGGLLAFMWFLPRKLTVSMGRRLAVAGMYWLFVDFVWLAIFVILYF